MSEFGPETGGNRPRRRLSPALVAFIVVDVVLVIALILMFALSQLGGKGVETTQVAGGTTPAAQPATDTGTVTTPGATAASTPPAESPTPTVITLPSATPAAEPDVVLTEGGGSVFTSPSGNIACAIGTSYATCVIKDINTGVGPADATCSGGTVGYAVRVDSSGVVTTPCTSGSPEKKIDGAQVKYGESQSANGFTCNSAQNGMTCTNDATGTGFTIAKAGIQTF